MRLDSIDKKRPLALVAGGLVLALVAVGGWWIGTRGERRGAASTSGDEIELLRERLNRLEHEQGRQHAVSLGLARATAGAADKGGQDDKAAQAAAEPAPSPPRPSAKEQYEALEANFLQDPIEAKWAQPTEAQIKNVVGRFAGTQLLSASCRSKMCRLEVKFSNRESREAFETENGQMPPFANTHVWMQRFRGEGDDPTSRSVVIVSREGPLPLI